MPTPPANRDTTAEIGDINAFYANSAGSVGSTVANNARNILLGNFDAGAFFAANPGSQQQYESEDWIQKGWSPEAFAYAHKGLQRGDPALDNYFTGGVSDTVASAARRDQATQNELNTSARTATVNDLRNLGGATTDAFFAASPTLAGAANVISKGVNSLDLGAKTIAPVTFNGITPVGNPGGGGGYGSMEVGGPMNQPPGAGGNDRTAFIQNFARIGGAQQQAQELAAGQARRDAMGGGPMGPLPGGNFGPTPQNGSLGGAMGAGGSFGGPQAAYYAAPTENFSNPFMKTAGEYSSLALSPIQQMLQQQAMSDLRLGGGLSQQDVRMAQQSARAGQSARGLAMGANAIGEEILQTDALSRARLNERRGFAAAVDQNAFGQQNANRQLGLGYAGLANSAQQAGNSLGLGYNQLNENSRQFAGNLAFNYDQLGQQDRQFGQSMGFNYAQLGQQAGMFNASNNLAAQQFNASMAQTQQANDRTFGLNSTAMLGNIANNALAPLGAVGTGYNQANNNYITANQSSPSWSQYMGYAQDVNDTNYNAAQARYINSKNNAAAEKGAWIGLAGKVLGAATPYAADKLFG